MKKSLLALAVLGACSGAAMAQSSVTIYGVADIGAVWDKNGSGAGNNWRLQSGQQQGSRLGFRGREDLGGGTAAIFTLENGFNLDNGTAAQGGRLFGRQAWVGLQGGFGAVKLGRQQTELYYSLLAADPFQFGLTGAGFNYFGYGLYGVDPLLRSDNTINYTSPNFAGLTGSVSYGFGETPGNFSAGRTASAGLSYANGPVDVRFAYQNSKAAPIAAASIPTFAALGIGAGVPPGTAATRDLRSAFLGGTYDFGIAKAHLAFAETRIEPVGTGISAKDRNYLVGVSAPVGTGTVLASWIRNDIRDVSAGKSDNFALGYTYPLSKRTNLYTAVGFTKNDDAVRLNAYANGEDSRQFQVGIRHVF